jgi:teichuronic acid biosynthesis glycosyltransferase TuaC
MHVLTLTPFYPCSNDDATGCFVSEPLPWLAKKGVRHTVIHVEPFYRRHQRGDVTSPPAEGISYFSIPGNYGLPSSGTFLFARLRNFVRRKHRVDRIHVIHAHGALPCGHAAALISRELGIPFVVSVHGLDAFSTVQASGYLGRWCRRISAMVFRAAHRVICVSEHVRAQVLAGAGEIPEPVVVYNGVDASLFAPHADCKSGPVILSVGNLIPIKGHELLLRAFAQLEADFPHVCCEIIGEGPERDRLAALAAQLDIAQRVHFCGRQDRRTVAEKMQECTVFALPSRYEGLGCVYLEAMAAGKPAIACRGQGIEEIIEHGNNGFLIGVNESHQLAATLSEVLKNREMRARVGRNARNTVLQSLTLGHQAERLCDIYQRCVA